MRSAVAKNSGMQHCSTCFSCLVIGNLEVEDWLLSLGSVGSPSSPCRQRGLDLHGLSACATNNLAKEEQEHWQRSMSK
jgi:hypothetical protein